MLDINKAIGDPEAFLRDPEGSMYELPYWSPAIAQELADKEGLGELSDLQWRVIHALRSMYRREHWNNAHLVLRTLVHEFAELGGSRFLFRLFPQGPVTQGSRLAGLPAPPYANDRSFGSFS